MSSNLTLSATALASAVAPPSFDGATVLASFVYSFAFGVSYITMWYFYVLQSLSDENYFYKGSTNDLDRRLKQHNNGEVFSSAPKRPYRLVYYEAYLYEFAARIRESSVKKNGNISTPLLRRIRESLKKNSEF